MLNEIAGFFTFSVGNTYAKTFVGWSFDEPNDLEHLPYTVSGIVMKAYSERGKDTTVGEKIEIISVHQSTNIRSLIAEPTFHNAETKANLILIRQVDDAKERQIEYKLLTELYG